MSNSVCLSPESTYLRRERLAGAAGILPGMLLGLSAGDVIPQATPDQKVSVLRVADINIGDAGDINTAYSDNETVHYVHLLPGAQVTLILADGETIADGDELSASGGGEVGAPAVAGTGVLFIADEAVTTSGSTAFIQATVANF